MIKNIPTLTQERLKQAFQYDPNTGIFVWLISTSDRIHIGNRAGGIRKDGRWRISLDGTRYYAYDLAWLYIYGTWPSQEIDHKDRNPSNDRIDNLRLVTSAQNKHNRITPRKGTSLLGAWPYHRKWFSQICVNGKKIHLGYFLTPEAAHKAHMNAKRLFQEGYLP